MSKREAINEENHYVVIGKVVDTYGLKGELKVQPYLELKHWQGLKRVFLKRKTGEYVPFTFASLKPYGGLLLLRFEGCESLTQAESYKGAKLFLPKKELPKRKKGEYYYYELEGLEVFTEEGKRIGKITGLVEQKPYDFLEVDGGRLLIPFVRALVKKVRLKEGKLVVSNLLSEL